MNIKKRNWTVIVYPESAPSDWIDLLQQTGLEVAISPLHDKDLNPTGEFKKAHYHVLLCYPGPTTFNTVQQLSSDILSGVMPKPIESIRGMYRYLTHKDNPEKTQYKESDIILLNGFDPSTVLSNADESAIKQSIIIYIQDNKIFEYSDLIDKLLLESVPDMYHVASQHTIFFNTYLSSRRNKEKQLDIDHLKRLKKR